MNGKLLKMGLAAALALLSAALIHIMLSQAGASENVTTQEYTPAHYMILAAEINVSSPQSPSNTRKVMLRTNTNTGQCWVLELSVLGDQNFRVSKAHWKEVAARGNMP